MIKTPSPEQQNVFDEVKTGKDNLAIQATAGSGKTSTLIHILSILPRFKRILFTSFSNAIVKELLERMPSHVKGCTIHSLGFGFVRKRFGNVTLDENKYFKFALQEFPQKSKEVYKKCFDIQALCNYARLTLSNFTPEHLEVLCERYGIDATPESILVSCLILESHANLKYASAIDFCDMIYLPAKYPELVTDQFDYVCVDEVQDTNTAQATLISHVLKPTGRIIFVGDTKQCQPAGTKVLLRGSTYINIEDLKIGDPVVACNISDGRGFMGVNAKKSVNRTAPIIEDISSRDYNGELIKVESEGKISRYTPDHICLARFSPKSARSKAQVLYLMEKNGFFRIGITPLWGTGEGNYSFTFRAKCECAEKMWILNIYNTRQDAYIDEQYFSFKYSIPQSIFKNNGSSIMTQVMIDELWNRFDKYEMGMNALAVLSAFGKMYEYPMYDKSKHNYYSKNGLRPIVACNLFDKYMQIGHFGNITYQKKSGEKTHVSSYHDFVLTKEHYEGKVYSLQVSRFQNYVADGIVTHNCIYSFQGANIDSFERMEERFKTKKLNLTVTYRVPKTGVQLAQTVYPDVIQAHHAAIEGINREGVISEAEHGDMVLCRNTKPLVAAFFELLSSGKKAYVEGKDYEAGLKKLAESVEGYSFENIKNNVETKLVEFHGELLDAGITSPQKNEKFIALQEKCEVLLLILSMCDKPTQLLSKIADVFHEDKQAIKLMTIHRAKGRENDRVFLIEKFNNEKLIPSKYATNVESRIQENNLLFVAYTRHKKEIVRVNYNS